MTAVLDVQNLNVKFRQDGSVVHAVRNVSFTVAKGETLAIVGESGSGKSVTALSTVSLLADSAQVSGSITYNGKQMVGATEPELRRVRGNDISFIFQEPMTSLNPLHTIERQLAESIELHQGLRPQSLGDRFLLGWMGLKIGSLFPVFFGLAYFRTVLVLLATWRSLWDQTWWDFTLSMARLVIVDPVITGAILSVVVGGFLWCGQFLIRRFLAGKLSRDPMRLCIIELLTKVGIRDPETRLGAYPHELSGGQRQRVMIAMALANGPELLIADEPTTALDVTIQAQILDLLADLKAREGMSLLFITHDLTIVRKIADRVCVMKDGEIVEQGPTAQIFSAPQHSYTQMLLAAESTGVPLPVPADAPVVATTDALKIWFPLYAGLLKRTVGYVKAVNAASLSVRVGETVGIVGESGSGKTTLALAIMRLIRSEGPIGFLGQPIQDFSQQQMRPLRKEMQIVFQDPFGSLSPRMTIEQIIAEGLGVHGLEPGRNAHDMVTEMMTEVGLDPALMDRYPHEFSGGQRQRIAIARALILRPKLMVLDEPTSALDMTVQVQIVQLLRDLQQKYGLAYLFISHDLKVVRALSHKVMVMKNGDVVEQGDAQAIFDAPQSDYTKALMKAAYEAATG